MSGRALVLDFGGVITRTMFETHRLTEKALGLPTGTLTWMGPFDPANDPLWRSMQEGMITERDYWLTRTLETGRMIGRKWTRMEDFVKAARGDDPEAVIRPEAAETVRKARYAGRKLAILSNELDLFYGADFRKKLPLLDEFHVIVDATYTNILKPDPRAYAAVVDGLGVDPADCVFVDDQPKNIYGAEAAGMTTVHFDVKHPAVGFATALDHLGLGPDPEQDNDAA